jgi:transcriptional regulator with XRE-family HTH domain
MEMLGGIRRMYLRDKLSLHEITKRTGMSRNTVRRWLRAPEEVKSPTYSGAAGFGKLGSFIAELEQALKADAGG